MIAIDLPGFGDSDKPLSAAYDAPYFADAVVAMLDALGLERADLVGNSMGGRVAIEAGLRTPDRVGRLVLLSPAVAWLRDRNMKWLVRCRCRASACCSRPRGYWWSRSSAGSCPAATAAGRAAGVDEFLRSYLTPSGRYAFYESARNIYLDEPRRRGRLLAPARGARAAVDVRLGAGTTTSSRSRS